MRQRQQRKERFIIFLMSLATLGLIVENFVMGWENWVPIVMIVGILTLWLVHLSGRVDPTLRTGYYFFFAMLVVFYHGVHETSLFDIAVVTALAMVAYASFDHVYMMNLFLAEYFFLVLWHLFRVSGEESLTYDALTVSRLLLHALSIAFVYFITTRGIMERQEDQEKDDERNAQLEAYSADIEDFLSNISHELRTPINVVSGMSDLLIKRNVGYEAEAIKNAGIRLTYQIEDIQDYNECKRKKLILEEEDYMSTSLINDVVASFRLEDHDGLELVVDLDPKVPTKMRGDIKKLHKIFRHLLENAVKFTKEGGIYVHMYAERENGSVNLCIEMTDTGIGMDRKALDAVAEGLYQANKKRNRSSGGIGLGLYIVYGFAHVMGGFVKIESERGTGTTIRVTVPQRVVDEKPCMALSEAISGSILFHVKSDKYRVPQLRDFYRAMAGDLAAGLRASLYSAETIRDVERMREKVDVSFIFMGQEEYEENSGYFDAMCQEGIIVVVSADPGFKPSKGSRVMVMPKPLYAYPVIRVLNEGWNAGNLLDEGTGERPDLTGVRALIVDDEPMNLVVATGIFKDYGMIIDTVGSGREAMTKFRENDYDVVFMDHMMPEMDGVEAMKNLRDIAADMGKSAVIVALTANVVSGAREMFIREGFDGFIAKPIHTPDFERVMLRELPAAKIGRGRKQT